MIEKLAAEVEFESGNTVALKAFPTVRMLVVSVIEGNCECMWFSTSNERQVDWFCCDWLELSGL